MPKAAWWPGDKVISMHIDACGHGSKKGTTRARDSPVSHASDLLLLSSLFDLVGTEFGLAVAGRRCQTLWRSSR